MDIGLIVIFKQKQDKQNQELSVIAQKDREERQAEKQAEKEAALEREQLRQNDSFYQKLADGFDVNVLVVGDSIGAGSGASDGDHAWPRLLVNSLSSKWNVGISLMNVSMGGNSSFAGYVRTMALDNSIDYDLVLICYGQNDANENFEIYYESIIRAIKSRYSKASIISILESSQKDYTNKMQSIKRIASHYGIPVADTIAPFQNHHEEYTSDGVHPNDKGQIVYYETLMDIIEPFVDERRKFDPTEVSIMNEKVTAFDTMKRFSADQFKRTGNTFILETVQSGMILGIDYTFVSGENNCKIFIDGVEYAAPEVRFDYDFSQRHIMVVNKWMTGDEIDIKREIKVSFSEGEAGKKQADGFKGLVLTSQNTDK